MVSCYENKMHKEIIFLPFCCFHVQGHQKPKLKNENDLLTSLKSKIPNFPAICMTIFKQNMGKLVILFIC